MPQWVKRKGADVTSVRRKGLRSEAEKLALDLKELCDEKGKEINPRMSAGILHQMGLLYKAKSSETISLIRSAALLNSAIVRQPGNSQFQKDLKELCRLVLKAACAENPDEDLVKIANEVLIKIRKMRRKAKGDLKRIKNIEGEIGEELKLLELEKIKEIQRIQDGLTDNYNDVMAFIAKKCEYIMGKPPCRYSLVGMGSLARKEITPFSDFENIIVLEEGVQSHRSRYDVIMHYFRWYATIFQIILVNLKETILRFLCIPHLNDAKTPNGDWFYDCFTKCGISPDGFAPHASKNPLGRTQKTKKKPWTTELIKPVSEMILYLNSDVDLKNGYHLADMLTKTCFVFGHKETYIEFSNRVEMIMNQRKEGHQALLAGQLREDLKNFDPMTNLVSLQASSRCDIKRVLYRSTTLYVAALGRLHSIYEGSCFEIIQLLKKKSVISDETAHKLSYAVAVACQIRIKIYTLKSEQNDLYGEDNCYDVDDNIVAAHLMSIVGKKSLVDYLETSYMLQKVVQDRFALSSPEKYFKTEFAARFHVLGYLKLHDEVFEDWERFKQEMPPNILPEDELWIRFRVADSLWRVRDFASALEMYDWIITRKPSNLCLEICARIDAACSLCEMEKYKEALSRIEQTKQVMKNYDLLSKCIPNQTSDLAFIEGRCYHQLRDYGKALVAYERELEGLNQPESTLKGSFQANCHNNMGYCLMELRQCRKAIKNANASLEISQRIQMPLSIVCSSYKLLGCSHFVQENYQKALDYFQTELDLRIKFTPPEERDTDEDLEMANLNVKAMQEALNQPTSVVFEIVR